MQKKSFLWQLFFRTFLIAAITLTAVGIFSSLSVRSMSRAQAGAGMIEQAKMLKPYISGAISSGSDLSGICAGVQESGTYLTVVTTDGTVLCDNLGEQLVMGRGFSEQPEINSALRLKEGISIRLSPLLKKDLIYVALPLNDAGVIKALIRLAKPADTIRDLYFKSNAGIGIFVFFAFLVSGLISWLTLKRMVTPIEELTKGAMAIASGDLTNRLYIPSIQEMETLAESMNEMATQLNERIRMVSSQRNELEAVLASMVEGVIAIDLDECVISINHSAEQIIGVPHDNVKGKKIHELTRNISLLKYVDAAIASDARKEEDIILTREGRRILNARSSPLMGINNERIGTLFVFNDVTKLRRLENMRRDFAANVSHEIKTPLTSIKGFVETLHNCMDDDPGRVGHFLEIIGKNINRLMLIIDDLLKLSKIENENDQNLIKFMPGKISDILSSVNAFCSQKAAAKDIAVEIVCPEALIAEMDASLMEQAVQNIVDNAIEYSNQGSSIVINASVKDEVAKISIKDSGIGIPYSHLDRIFERFYRVDKGRSRKAGGTGLGLAIVKHIMQAHGGGVDVKSKPGIGSTFTLTFPASRKGTRHDVFISHPGSVSKI